LRQVIILITNHWLIKEKLIRKLKIILILLNCPNLVIDMNAAQITSNELAIPRGLFSGSQTRTEYLWKNIVIEKRTSVGWLKKEVKDSVFYSFWLVLSSPVN
jgi:hypothetical protein